MMQVLDRIVGESECPQIMFNASNVTRRGVHQQYQVLFAVVGPQQRCDYAAHPQPRRKHHQTVPLLRVIGAWYEIREDGTMKRK